MDKLDVTFQGTVSKYENCMCSCCHDSEKVLKLQIPETLYFDGKSLSTKYHDVWVCKSCAQKMIGELEKLIPQPENKPLTLEQLRGMDGIPVYCIDGAGNKCWCIVNTESEDCIDNESGAWIFDFYDLSGNDGILGLDKQLGWLAYRTKPEQEELH